MPASKYKHSDEIELFGLRFRLRRITGFAAMSAKAAWTEAAGEEGAHLLALGSEQLAAVTEKIMSADERAAVDTAGVGDQTRFLALMAILLQVKRAKLTPATQAELVQWFILGWVDIEVGGKWTSIEATADLDKHLDGEHDGDVWTQLLYRQIPHCLGPSMPAAGTSSDTPATGQT